MDQKLFLTKSLFWFKIFLDPKCFGAKFFWTQNSFDRNIFGLKIFGPKIFSDQKFFWTQIFLDPNFFGPKCFWTQNWFEPEIFFDPKCTWDWSLTLVFPQLVVYYCWSSQVLPQSFCFHLWTTPHKSVLWDCTVFNTLWKLQNNIKIYFNFRRNELFEDNFEDMFCSSSQTSSTHPPTYN